MTFFRMTLYKRSRIRMECAVFTPFKKTDAIAIGCPLMIRHGAYGEAFRRMRWYRGINQSGLVIASSRTYVSEVERGRKSPTVRKIEAICDALDLPPLTAHTLAFAENTRDVGRLLTDAGLEAIRILEATKVLNELRSRTTG